MAYSEALANRVRAALAGQELLEEQKMFGGLAFMLHGNMCFGIIKDDLMVRVGPDQYDAALAQPYARELDFTGRPMRGMVLVTSPGLASDNDLTAWVQRGLQFVSTLPPK